MLTYQVRPRVLRIPDGCRLEFPAEVEVSLYLKPLQPFGMAPGGGLTAVRCTGARVLFDANTGQHSIESRLPLAPLDVRIIEPNRRTTLEGNRVTVRERCESNRGLTQLLESLYFGLPLLLALEFADPPIVERVDGRVGAVPFRWELSEWQAAFVVTTQTQQEERFATAWNRFDIVSVPERRRLLAALHYFHIACRLRREACTPGEFLAESLLNLTKVLEVLYGPSRDNVRTSLAKLGYTTEQIERDFIPAMLLRNSVDVGHPMLGLLKPRQLETLQRYTDRAEGSFRELLQRIFRAIEDGRLEIASYGIDTIDAGTQRAIEALGQRLDELGDRP